MIFICFFVMVYFNFTKVKTYNKHQVLSYFITFDGIIAYVVNDETHIYYIDTMNSGPFRLMHTCRSINPII